jgi:hypothetical protein
LLRAHYDISPRHSLKEKIMEHRWGRRVPAAIPVRLRAADNLREHPAHLANVSLSGGWIPAKISVRPLSRIQVVFEVRVPRQGQQTVNAYVARHSQAGIGLEWCEHAPEVIVSLLRALTLPDADLVSVHS